RRRHLNGRHTRRALLDLGIVPVVNENDTVSVEELRFGDNDTLSALTAELVEAHLLVLLTDVEGLHTRDPRRDPGATVVRVVRAGEEAEPHRGRPARNRAGPGGLAPEAPAAPPAPAGPPPRALPHPRR